MLTSSWLAWRSFARALSPDSMALPTDTMKFRPVVLDFIDTGGLVSSAIIKEVEDNIALPWVVISAADD